MRDLTSPTPRMLELDALRGLAALSVILYHYIERYDVLFHHQGTLPFRWKHGYYGVQLFFMISGWVIPLAAERAADAKLFAWARFTRLFPTYWMVCLLTYTLVAVVGLPGRVVPWTDALVNVTMLQELFDLRNIDGTFWSLQVELVFYLAVLVLVGSGRLRWLGPVLLGWVVVGLLVRPTLLALAPAQAPWLLPHLERIFILEWVHLFGLGYVFYRLSRRHQLDLLSLALIALGLWRQTQVSLPWSIWLLTAYLVIFGLSMAGALRFVAWRPLVALGAMSYPLYLVHSNIGYLVIRDMEGRGASASLAIGAAMAVAFALAFLLHHGVEEPARLALRGMLAARRRPTEPVPPVAQGLAPDLQAAMAMAPSTTTTSSSVRSSRHRRVED